MYCYFSDCCFVAESSDAEDDEAHQTGELCGPILHVSLKSLTNLSAFKRNLYR